MAYRIHNLNKHVYNIKLPLLFSQDNKLSRTRHCSIFSSAVTTVCHEYGDNIAFFQYSKTPIYNPFLALL